MLKNLITSFLVITIAIVALMVIGDSGIYQSRYGVERKVNAQSAPAIPLHILYDQLFRLQMGFKSKAEGQKIRGKRETSLKNYFKDEAALTDSEEQSLDQVTREYLNEIRPIDKEARELISQVREQFQFGEVQAGQQIPEPPARLAELQTRKNEIVLAHREKLRVLLGEGSFTKLDNFIQQKFASNFQSVASNPQQ